MLLIILTIRIVSIISVNLSPLVQVPQGSLRGQFLKTANNRTISSFTGIPYAQPPVGNLRFETSRPARHWKGILDATRPHAPCPQVRVGISIEPEGDEDCLYLNVYTPKDVFNNNSFLYPVMIYIHGGGLQMGDANRKRYNPTYLLDKDIVLVTINYRLGPLGFISTGDAVLPGNNGLKDQSLAIRWVKSNIMHFGGNPIKITLFGNSAGGASTNFHMLSPLNLISGVISQSGTAFSPWILDVNNRTRKNTIRLAKHFNCSVNTSIAIRQCLKKVDALKMAKIQHEFYDWRQDPWNPFRPVIDNNVEGAFLPDHPTEIIKSGKAAKVPFLTGITTEDGGIKTQELYEKEGALEDFTVNFEKVAPITFLYSDTSPKPDFVTEKIRAFYFDNMSVTDPLSLKDALTKAYTDCYFLYSANRAVSLHSKYNRQSVYYYIFGYNNTISYCGNGSIKYGACHEDELLYLFDPSIQFPNYKPSEIDRIVTDILISAWTNFATTGSPNLNKSDQKLQEWEPVESNQLEYYFIKNYTRHYTATDINFWKKLPLD